MIKVAVLDDYQNIFKEIIDTESHKTKIEFKVFNHKFENQEDLIQELDSFEALFLMRERTQINSEIINSLPKLKYIMTSGILVVAQRFSAYFGAAVPLTLAYLMHSDGFKNHQFLLVAMFAILNFVSLFYFNNFVWLPDSNYYELYNAETF